MDVMMIRKAFWIGLTLLLLGFVSASNVRGDEWNKKTLVTFSHPVEIPGHVLPAGTYTFKLLDSMIDRHIVQIFNADESEIIATVMTIPDFRLTPTDRTVITFDEVPAGSPEAIRAWFYPGNTMGQEFVYPKSRATQLAKAAKAVVPAIAVDVADVEALKTARIVAITPDAREIPVTAAVQTTPAQNVASVVTAPNNSSTVAGTTGVKPTSRNARHLPKTASALPLILLFGLGSLGVGFGLMVFGKHTTGSAL
jgi:hypothetical protein